MVAQRPEDPWRRSEGGWGAVGAGSGELDPFPDGIVFRDGSPGDTSQPHALSRRLIRFTTRRGRGYFASFFIQFTDTTIGALLPSTAVFSRNRPSRDTAYAA